MTKTSSEWKTLLDVSAQEAMTQSDIRARRDTRNQALKAEFPGVQIQANNHSRFNKQAILSFAMREGAFLSLEKMAHAIRELKPALYHNERDQVCIDLQYAGEHKSGPMILYWFADKWHVKRKANSHWAYMEPQYSDVDVMIVLQGAFMMAYGE